MNLHRMLLQRAAAGTPLRVALIGAGKFGSMHLAQAAHAPVPWNSVAFDGQDPAMRFRREMEASLATARA